MADGDLTGAKEYYLKALAIRERLAADAEGTQAQDDIGISYAKLALLEGLDTQERLSFASKAERIFGDLFKKTGLNSFQEKATGMTMLQQDLCSVPETSETETPTPETPTPEATVPAPETPTPETPVEQPQKTHLVGKIIGGLLAAGIVALIALQLTGVIDVTEWFAELPGLFR